MPVYEYGCKAGHRFEVTQKFSDLPITDVPGLRPAGLQADFGAGDNVQGVRLVYHGLFGQAQADGRGEKLREHHRTEERQLGERGR